VAATQTSIKRKPAVYFYHLPLVEWRGCLYKREFNSWQNCWLYTFLREI